MPIPKLHHAVGIKVKPISYSNTAYDNVLKEPIHTADHSQLILIPGQIDRTEYYSYGTGVSFNRSGRQQSESAYVLFRYDQARALGWKPAIGDQIVEFGYDTLQPIVTNVYITLIRPTGHYKKSGPTLFRAYFADKEPARHPSG